MENEAPVVEHTNEEKKEVQKKIIELSEQNNGKATEEEFVNILRLLSPGTNLRTSLEGIVKIGKGAIIVVENELTEELLDGGFKLNCRFTPQKLMELSKMDGALVLSKDMKKIMYANVLLTPSSNIPTIETGTRHKAAERTSKMTGTLVIAVSERKNEITVYYKNIRYPLINSNELLRKANEQIQLLEKQRELFDSHVEKLDKFEIQNYHGLHQATQVIQKGYVVQRMASEIQRSLIELGKEGTLLKTRFKELLSNVEQETELVIKDYTKLDMKKSRTLLRTLSYDELLDLENIFRALAYETKLQQKPIRGWRILGKTSLEEPHKAALVKESASLGKAINSNIAFYKTIFGDQEKAERFKDEIERLKLSYNY
jgi:diadenylate cyclase